MRSLLTRAPVTSLAAALLVAGCSSGGSSSAEERAFIARMQIPEPVRRPPPLAGLTTMFGAIGKGCDQLGPDGRRFGEHNLFPTAGRSVGLALHTDDFEPTLQVVDSGGKVLHSVGPTTEHFLVTSWTPPENGGPGYRVRVLGEPGSGGDYQLAIDLGGSAATARGLLPNSAPPEWTCRQ